MKITKSAKLLLLTTFLLGITFTGRSQVNFYAFGGPEIIFSLAEIDDPARSGSNILRFSPVFNIQVNGNVDFGNHFGFVFGGAIRNVGFIYEYADTTVGSTSTFKKKYRNYSFGLPIGIKLGMMNKWLFYGGYEIEFPFA